MDDFEGFSSPTYSFSDLWLDTTFADVLLTIPERESDGYEVENHQVSPAELATKRPLVQPDSTQSVTIPSHRVLLLKSSEYFKTQLITSVGSDTNGSCLCTLQVEKGELKVAKAVIQPLYMGLPDTLSQVCCKEHLHRMVQARHHHYGYPRKQHLVYAKTADGASTGTESAVTHSNAAMLVPAATMLHAGTMLSGYGSFPSLACCFQLVA